jgi:hypothetical protein
MWITDGNFLPQFFIFIVVVRMYEVEIKSTDVGFDLDGAVITPMTLAVPNAVAVRTRITPVIPVRLKLRIA